MIFDLKKKEIRFKIVYYGPALSGKTTNIVRIHDRFPGKKGKLITIDTQGERTIFFDLLPIEVQILKGFRTRFYLYTVPGQVHYRISRKLVLKGADGVIFVADSQADRLEENIDIYRELMENLKKLSLNGDRIPIIMQYNKRDLPDRLPVEKLEKELNVRGYPYYSAIAIKGIGVFKTLEGMIRKVIEFYLSREKG
ncbi:MAG: gliding-motility protein MglA [Candidatus Hydrothermota bacterium]|uniref:Gliding-motility protein MglA n=1 Tax=candidate division WOR-3 bacterium TaxID=2052148 RepID=A0A7C1BJX8_UNCW3|nr:MAG: gliding-motility protein MglA [Candidatus Hydrothermae bacterium]HDM90853.1 gliding-motility protein MglA [candidate division WOR-3 bacterium]